MPGGVVVREPGEHVPARDSRERDEATRRPAADAENSLGRGAAAEVPATGERVAAPVQWRGHATPAGPSLRIPANRFNPSRRRTGARPVSTATTRSRPSASAASSTSPSDRDDDRHGRAPGRRADRAPAAISPPAHPGVSVIGHRTRRPPTTAPVTSGGSRRASAIRSCTRRSSSDVSAVLWSSPFDRSYASTRPDAALAVHVIRRTPSPNRGQIGGGSIILSRQHSATIHGDSSAAEGGTSRRTSPSSRGSMRVSCRRSLPMSRSAPRRPCSVHEATPRRPPPSRSRPWGRPRRCAPHGPEVAGRDRLCTAVVV